MFDIHGDEITFRDIHFATIDGKAWPTLRDEASDSIRFMTNEDKQHEKECKAFEEGEEQGISEGKANALREIRDAVEASFTAGELSVCAYSEICRILSVAEG